MRPTAEQDLRPEGPSLPEATWRVPPQHVERRLSIGTDLLWQRVATFGFLLLGVIYLVGIARTTTNPDTFMGAHFKSLALIAITQVVIAIIYRRISTVIENGVGLGSLKAKLPVPDAIPVRLDVLHKGTVTGSDEGFFWIADDVLTFKGMHTAFRIARHDLPPVAMWPKGVRPRGDAPAQTRFVPVPDHEETTLIRLVFIDPFEDYDARRRTTKADRLLKEWMSMMPTGESSSLLPPLSLHPAFALDQKLNRQGVWACGIVTLLNLALLATTRFTSAEFVAQPIVSLLNAAILPILAVGMGYITWLEVRDQRHRQEVTRKPLDVMA
ncbi:MAG: hypothetical protein KF812_03255 [Fimbriimonadaceae bacterium]|nr:hypothetical protein [Fimbriimonadaceae bacterium]